MAAASFSPPPVAAATSSSRRSRQSIEEELWLLRSRTFVKSESLRLNNSLSPRSRTTSCDDFEKKDCSDRDDRPRRRRWRRRIRHDGDDKNANFVERMRDAARKAKVFQLRIAGRRSWWPSMHTTTSSTARIIAESDCSYINSNRQRQKHDETELKSTSTNQLLFDNRTKKNTTTSSDKKQQSVPIPKQKFEWNKFWKKRNSSDTDECMDVDISLQSSSTANNNDTIITTAVDDVHDGDLAIMKIAENMESEQKKKKKQQHNIIVAAVATTSVSSLGVALAIILL